MKLKAIVKNQCFSSSNSSSVMSMKSCRMYFRQLLLFLLVSIKQNKYKIPVVIIYKAIFLKPRRFFCIFNGGLMDIGYIRFNKKP